VPKTYGDRDAYSVPVYHAWGGGVACSAHKAIYNKDKQDYRKWIPNKGPKDASATVVDVDGSSEKARQMGAWEHKTPCNLHFCPIDCVVSPWTAWSTCSKTCATGNTYKTRTVTTPVQYGGKACPVMRNDKTCNVHKCSTTCNDQHSTCKVVQWKWKCDSAACMKKNHLQAGTRTMYKKPFCKTRQCMKANGIMESIQVHHHKKFSSIAANFKCALSSPTQCTCECSAHPTGCYSKNKKWSSLNKIESNSHPNVANYRKCSDICRTHPSCTHWDYSATLKQCTLLKGQVPSQVAAIGSFAGLRAKATESLNNCARELHKPVLTKPIAYCKPNTYIVQDKPLKCAACPAGKYNKYANQRTCYKSYPAKK